MATFVLVPGFWLGAWAWEQVTAGLRDAGHAVHPVTLTGLGDRVHLARREVDLETHTTDILNVIEYAGLDEVILVGHSGGGMPVSLAADRRPERIRRAVYVDSAPLPDGMSQFTTNPPDVQEAIRKQVAEEGDGWLIPVPAWQDQAEDPVNLAELTPELLAAMRSRAVPQPFAPSLEPIRRSARGRVPETLVACTFPEEQVRRFVADGHPMFAGFGAEFQIAPLPTGHWPMFSRPAETVALLASLG